MTLVLTAELASVVPRFCDGGRGPSHDELTLLIREAGLHSADPGSVGPAGPIGKMKRLRRVMVSATTQAPENGGRLVEQLVHATRGAGGFTPGNDQYVGDEVFFSARRAFAETGYELDPEGHLRPLLLEGLAGHALTDALWTYVRRARSGASDDGLVVGTAKDLAEAIARHVLVELDGSYSPNMGVPGTIFHAYYRLGLAAPDPKVLEMLDADPRNALHQAVYTLACAANRFRNAQGTGHGRPLTSTADPLDGRLCAQAAGALGDLLLTTLADGRT